MDVNQQDDDGCTALMYSCTHTMPDKTTINILLESGADVNLQTKDGRTALMMMDVWGSVSTDILTRLIDAGAYVNLQDNTGMTALMYACTHKGGECATKSVKILLDTSGVNVNLQNNDGQTALMLKVADAHIYTNTKEVTEMLLKAGADTTITNKDGKTAYDIAMSDAIKQVLRDASKNTRLTTISLADWSKGTTFQVVLERLSSSSDDNDVVRNELATIIVEDGDTGDITLTLAN